MKALPALAIWRARCDYSQGLSRRNQRRKKRLYRYSFAWLTEFFSIMFFFIDKSGKTGVTDFFAPRRLSHVLEARIFFALPRL
jgi:hypothetical protein